VNRAAVWLTAATIASVTAGCGKPVLRIADASLGDYYTDKEFKKLSKEQRDDYCNELALQDSMYLEEIQEGTASLAEVDGRREPLRREVDSLLAEADRREQNTRTLLSGRGETPAGGDAAGEATRQWNVRRGDSLWRISSQDQVYGDGAQWRRIYESNRGSIQNPDLIFPGQELSIPR
jgi:nucleoid-associated protein YgaU